MEEATRAADGGPSRSAVVPLFGVRRAPGGIVERAREKDALLGALEAARGGRGQLVLLAGEPGIGKSTLAEFVSSHAAEMLVLRGVHHDDLAAPPYWAWSQVLSGLRDELNRRSRRDDDLLRAAREVLAEIRPSNAQIDAGAPRPVADAEQARFRLFASITDVLRRASRGSPLVIVLEDLHWADRPSLLLLEFIAVELDECPLLVVATHRTHEPGRDDALEHLVGAIAGKANTEILHLAGLSTVGVSELLRATLQEVPDPALVTRIHARTSGNPFFVREIGRILQAENPSGRDGIDDRLPLPPTVKAAVRRRLARLGPETHQVLCAASVLGDRFRRIEALAVSEMGAAEFDEALGPALAVQAVSEEPHSPGSFKFTHALVRETLYADLNTRQRADLHARAVVALEARAVTDDLSVLADLARHAFEAASVLGPETATEHAIRAGSYAMTVLAFEEAVDHFDRAVRTLRMSVDRTASAEAKNLVLLGDAQTKSGDLAAARETLRTALDLAETGGDFVQFADAALHFGGSTEGFELAEVQDQEIVRVLERALDLLPDGNTAIRARLLARLAVAGYWLGYERAEAHGLAAVAVAEEAGEVGALLAALSAKAWWPTSSGERQELATRMARLAVAAGDVERELQARRWALHAHVEVGDLVSADADIVEIERLAKVLGQPIYSAQIPVMRAMQAFLEGRFDEASAYATEGYALGERAGNPVALEWFGATTFFVLWLKGEIQSLEPALRSLMEQAAAATAAPGAIPFLASELGLLDEARLELERYSGGDLANMRRQVTGVMNLCLLAAVAARLGDEPRCHSIGQLLEPFRGTFAIASPPPVLCVGPVDYYLGLMARGLGQHDRAAALFQTAMELCDRAGAHPFGALARIELAETRMATGVQDRTSTLQLAAAAGEVATALGMTPVRTRADLILAASDGQLAEDPPEFTRSDSVWTLRFRSQTALVPDARGVAYLAELVRNPGQDLHVLDLAGSTAPRAQVRLRALDDQARAAYRQRVGDLRAAIDEADADHDIERSAQAQQELDLLTVELATAYGIGGRERPVADDVERARKAVTNRIRDSIRKIGAAHPPLGDHLATAVSTGMYCAYRPTS